MEGSNKRKSFIPAITIIGSLLTLISLVMLYSSIFFELAVLVLAVGIIMLLSVLSLDIKLPGGEELEGIDDTAKRMYDRWSLVRKVMSIVFILLTLAIMVIASILQPNLAITAVIISAVVAVAIAWMNYQRTDTSLLQWQILGELHILRGSTVLYAIFSFVMTFWISELRWLAVSYFALSLIMATSIFAALRRGYRDQKNLSQKNKRPSF